MFMIFWEIRLYTRHINTPPSNDTMITIHFPQSSIHSGSAPAIDHDLDVWIRTALAQRVPAKVFTRVGQTLHFSHMVAKPEVRNDRCGKRAVTEMAVAVTVVTSERRETEMKKMEKDEVQIKQEWLSRPSEVRG